MRLIERLHIRLRLRSEQGFTMLVAIGAMSLVLTLSVVGFTAINTQVSATGNDLQQKEAYAAAQAGVQQYLYDLDNNNQYWSQCVPSTPNGINNTGSTANKRNVPGSSVEQYAIELLPAAGQSTYTQCSTAAPGPSMIQTVGSGAGSLRIRVTGYAGNQTRTLVAQLRESTFLDFVWFTQYETDDPAVQLIANGCSPASCAGGTPSSWSTALASAQAQCGQYYRSGRPSQPYWTNSSGTAFFCDKLQFIPTDNLRGPIYTDDEFLTCSPTFGRPGDRIFIGAPAPGESNQGYSGCSGTATNNGPVINNAPILQPPAGNTSLLTAAQNGGLVLTGPSCITLNGTTNTISVVHPASGYTCATATSPATTYPWPSNGTVFVQNNSGGGYACTLAYNYSSPDYTTDATDNGCGQAYVAGTYGQALTIGAQNDVIVTGDTTYTSATGNALLGLIAMNGFVRVQKMSGASPGNRTIDAAILSVQHSFIVDNYRTGSPMGQLIVNGSIGQDFRGGVGTSSGGSLATGYSKSYTYDDRLRYEEPPNFLDPTVAQWNIVRQNECVDVGTTHCA